MTRPKKVLAIFAIALATALGVASPALADNHAAGAATVADH